MQSIHTKADSLSAPKANAGDGTKGKSMPAVPVLQQKAIEGDEPQQNAPVVDANITPAQPKRFESPIQKKVNNTGLPDNLKSGIENLSGFSMDDTRVHYNSSQPAQLNAYAYAQGSDIHVAPRQEKHLPHEAWHVVQQKQARVKATRQMKGNVPVNDDAGLESEADLMGAKAVQAADIQVNSFANGNTRRTSLNLPVQRVLNDDGNGYTLPNNERTLNGFLTANGFVLPFACSAADHVTLSANHAILLNLIAANATADEGSAGWTTYEALAASAGDMNLVPGCAAWNTAVLAGATRFEGNPGAGDQAAKDAAAAAEWTGRAAAPVGFAQAVTAKIVQNAADLAAARETAYLAYQGDGRLLVGTINLIKQALGAAPTVAAINTRLAAVYARQCNITRQNWLTHLEVAGATVNNSAVPNVHFTKYNNAVAAEGAIAGLRVDQHDVAALCDELFVNYITANFQLHATVEVGAVSHHKYWGGHRSPGVPGGVTARLNTEYDRMRDFFITRVTSAKASHGRVAANQYAQQTNANVGP
jgi:hypothetical protein